jgi:hypothetical protein
MATQIKSSDLDFTNIKNNLKNFFKNKSEFSDYDFEASGLSNILDVLAYNSHINGLTANFSLNEAFLTTAQLRSSVVSHAQTLGYEVYSRKAASATVNLNVNLAGVTGRPARLQLAKGTQFTSSIDGVTYTFRTRESFFAKDDGTGLYVFKTTDDSENLPIVEGTEKTKTFFVPEKTERQVYVIPDETIDTSTAEVNVFESASSSSFTSYTPISQAISVDENSTHFALNEAPNGFYELNFGDGISFGKSPEPGEKVVVTYLSSKGADANNGTVFTPSSDVTVNGVDYTLSVVTVTESTGGAAKQSIESIKQLAPIAFAGQKRLVTSFDYKAMVESNFPQVESASVWSGDQNEPLDYGAVYISLQFQDNTSDAVKQSVKDLIKSNYTNNLSVMSMTTKFTDPEDVFLQLDTRFAYDPGRTGITLLSAEERVFNLMKSFFKANVSTFGGIFRKSNLLTEIDALDDSILSSTINVSVQMRPTITINTLNTLDVNFPTSIAVPDDVFFRVQSDAFEFNSLICTIKNRLGSTILEIVDLDGNVLLDNVGEYNSLSGKVSLVGFRPTQLISGQTFLPIRVTPRSEGTIKPLRNYILQLDTARSSATAEIDRQTQSLSVT